LNNAYANYALLPTLNATSGIIWNNSNQKQVLADGSKRERPDIKSHVITTSVNLNWTLFDGMRMFIARNRLGQLVELSELQIKSQVVNTVADVMTLYYDVVRQQQQLQAIEEQMRLSEERLRLAQYKFDIGTGAKPDLLQAQIDLNGQKSAHLTQQTAIIKIKEQLNQLLVLPLESNFLVADTTIEFNNDLTLDEVRTGVNTTNPELLAAQKSIDIANLDLRIRRAERYPVVAFNSAYNFNRTDNVAVINPFQPLFNRNHGLNYGFTATVPIFNAYNNRRLTKVAEINVRTQQLLYERTQALIGTSIINAWRDYDLSKRALNLEEENMVLVRENLFIARERYRLGITTFLEMREAQRSLSDAAFRLIQARFSTKVAEITLMRLRGDLVK
jgi:outer membrane protein TolC